MSAKIGIVGLGVMGHHLALKMERNGVPVAGYDLDSARLKVARRLCAWWSRPQSGWVSLSLHWVHPWLISMPIAPSAYLPT
jgi:prephenate dehydrogenase